MSVIDVVEADEGLIGLLSELAVIVVFELPGIVEGEFMVIEDAAIDFLGDGFVI